MRKKITIALCALSLAGCATSGYKITGTWEGGDGKTVYLLREVTKGEHQAVDSATVTDGAFHFAGALSGIDKRQITAGTVKRDILLDGVPIAIKITTKTSAKSGKEIQFAEITGSPEQKILEDSQALATGKGFVSLGGMLLMMQVKDDSVKLDSVYRDVEVLKKEYDKKLRAFLDTTNDSYAITYMIGDFLVKEYPFDEVEGYYNRLTPRVKASDPGKNLKAKIENLKLVNIGGIAPEIALPAPDGSTFKLSALRGKYVLLDFWASWCGPCLAEVPNVKAIYDKYHVKGFEILGVSLDNKRDAWLSAIDKHDLAWHHVSSLEGWQCPIAALYNVTAIPRMYLLDPQGCIIGVDLRGEALADRVASLFAGK
ncbi:MAG: AhpC/TSA family protein [Odoribacteraceae bacterium]|nr:AhpC/TSA family protein [Odoribacteraceae bacterium]